MECKVKWIDGVSFVAETGSGHALVMDGAPEGGGRNLGPRPMEMVLLGTGGCSAYDVVVILKKSGQEISGCSVELKAERADNRPEDIHPHPHAFRAARQEPEDIDGGVRDQAVAPEILLRLDHARQDRRDHARLRDRGGVIFRRS